GGMDFEPETITFPPGANGKPIKAYRLLPKGYVEGDSGALIAEMSPAPVRQGTKLPACIAWLRDQAVAAGDVGLDRQEAIREGEKVGHSEPTMERAARQLRAEGVIVTLGNRWTIKSALAPA